MTAIRHLLSQWSKTPGFTSLAIVALALGLGACAAMFSVTHAVLLKPLPFNQPDRLVWIENAGGDGGLSSRTSRSFTLRDWREQSQLFEDIGGYFAFFDYLQYTLIGDGESLRLRALPVTQNLFSVLGVQPALGRGFVDEEMGWGDSQLEAVILTHEFWQRRFSGRADIIGTTLSLNNRTVNVVGVLPETFDVDSIFQPEAGIDLLIPFPINEATHSNGHTLFAIGRLRDGVTLSQAQAELEGINQRVQSESPERGNYGASASWLDDHVRGAHRPAFLLLSGAVLALLLIVCLNLSNLLLVRAQGRSRELATRMALGATPWQLARDALLESVGLALVGGVLGALLAAMALGEASRLAAYRIPLLEGVSLSPAVLIFTLLMTLISGLICGALPALQLWRGQAGTALNEGGSRGSAGVGATRVRRALAVTQVALACALLIASSLLVQSFVRVMDVDVGFDPEQALAVRVDAYGQLSSLEAANTYYQALESAVQSVPGVISTGLSDTLPFGRNRTWGVGAEGESYARNRSPVAAPRLINGGYLQTMRIPLMAGRYLDARDSADAPPAVVISESTAAMLWPNRDPIGQQLTRPGSDGPGYGQVVGVVADVPRELEGDVAADFYLSIAQSRDWSSLELIIRSTRPLDPLIGDVRTAITAFDPQLANDEVVSLQGLIDRSVASRRVTASLLGGFSSLALLVSALGVYSVIAFAASLRQREMAIRRALGSRRRDLASIVITEGVQVAIVGVVIGLLLALLTSGLLRGMLFGVDAISPGVFALNALAVAVVAVLASLTPAMRASRVEAVSLLR